MSEQTMPEVTLLSELKTYTFMFGKGEFNFVGGVPQKVPVAVAMRLLKAQDRKGNQLFRIEGLPTVVPPKDTPSLEQTSVEQKEEVGPRQLRFDKWHLNAA